MKPVSFVTCALMLAVSTIAGTQSAAQEPSSPGAGAPDAAALQAFARLKTLAGTWKGQATLGPGMVAPVRVSLRVTSGGAAILHEMVPDGRSDDPANGDDDPVTMLYMDAGRLMLTHYCDSGKNRPRMVAKVSADGKSVAFDFLDLSGPTKDGHMSGAVFTFVDANHHTEDWTFSSPGQPPAQAHIDIFRAK